MKQLKMQNIIEMYLDLKKQYSEIEVLDMPVYIGDDDELNGIHCAWCCEGVDEKDKEYECIIELINSNSCNIKFDKKAILIS